MKVMVMEHSTHIKRNTQPISKGILILLKGTQRNTRIIKRNSKEYSSWNTHIIKRNSLIETLILSKGTQRNTHIIKRNSKEHSYYQKELKGTLICGLEDTLLKGNLSTAPHASNMDFHYFIEKHISNSIC